MHKNTCFYALKKKIGNENRVPSILGLRLKVTVILLIYPFFDNTKFTGENFLSGKQVMARLSPLLKDSDAIS